ncbi:hemerythrin domain-containing protein [Anaerosphaera multitolerans]|uniref:Hemerythrin n=1 Tax=Anaerosphaera multitolerans TaxID=2487351 RepID=A0A437S5D4_9FIRM|nr:hemerythrin domain-containing protein [Anaerosphaera multitolerans]RVU54204.1 hemerythrin [Anaerosphaera multitolerans]
MFTIEFLKKEHEKIIEVVDKVEENCISIMNGRELNVNFYRVLIEYIRKFADSTHHKKEEDILFKYMVDNLGEVAEKLVKSGMLTEHQMARYYVSELENYLNDYEESKSDKSKVQVLANAMSYVNLLRIHVDKENNVVYPFGERSLTKELLSEIDSEMKSKIKLEEQNEERRKELLDKLFSL